MQRNRFHFRRMTVVLCSEWVACKARTLNFARPFPGFSQLKKLRFGLEGSLEGIL